MAQHGCTPLPGRRAASCTHNVRRAPVRTIQFAILTNDGKVILFLHLSVGYTHACLPSCH